jgi:sialate O-acetylesterase
VNTHSVLRSYGWILLAAAVAPARADVVLSELFSDHMVLQRERPVPVWGKAEPGEEVTVTIAGRSARAKADGTGGWQVRLEPLGAGGPHELTVAGRNTLVVHDVLVGEVWVCSGQSNMAFTVSRVIDAEKEIAGAASPAIRLLKVARRPADTPAAFAGKNWQVCSPGTVTDFSAVGYFFGRDLNRSLNVPVGLIDSAVGGTPAESWTPLPVLQANPAFRNIFQKWEDRFAAARAAQARSAASAPAARPGRPGAKPQATLTQLNQNSQRPAVLYNGMIHPLIPYAIRGAIWYQGEANAKYAFQYRTLFPTMIRSWRDAWGQGDFPFLFVQLTSYNYARTEPYQSAWAELREAQAMTLSLPHTGMAVTTDIGDATNIHPRNKQEVGRRLALVARATVYGENVAFSGPVYESMAIEGQRVRIRLKHVEGGLAVRGGGELKGFAVAGSDRRFVEAKAVIDGQAVVVSSDRVDRPVAVRYAWANVPEDNLVNSAGLPAAPFRTDDWPGITVNER